MTDASDTEVRFYHCTRTPAVEVALQLSARAHGAGERLLVVAAAPLLATLDERLWQEPPEGFLPHGLASDSEWAADQPILLSETPVAANGAGLLLLVAHPLPAAFAGFSRLFHLFEDGSEAHLRARTEWKALAGRPGVRRSYWQQAASGRWEQRG